MKRNTYSIESDEAFYTRPVSYTDSIESDKAFFNHQVDPFISYRPQSSESIKSKYAFYNTPIELELDNIRTNVQSPIKNKNRKITVTDIVSQERKNWKKFQSKLKKMK